MEFKDNLKQLRTQRGLTQAQLAEKLFVSRSTIAKWENGLGLPNSESMSALEELFGITSMEIATEEPESVIVKKNRKLRRFYQIIGYMVMLALLVFMCISLVAIKNGKYGFTPNMAAGVFADDNYIDTGDYRFYYFTFEGDWDDGRHWSDLQACQVIRKHFWGSTVVSESLDTDVVAKENYIVGRLCSIKGKNGYYNILYKAHIYGEGFVWEIPAELLTATSVTIEGTEYELQDGFFFVTPSPVEHFKIDGEWYDVV